MTKEPAATTQQPTALGTLWAGGEAAVWTIPLMIFAAHLTPHVRGIGFESALRLVVIAPAGVVVAVASAYLYRALSTRSERPRRVLAGMLLIAAVPAIVVAATVGSFAAVWPTILVGAVATLWLVPRRMNLPQWSRVGTAAVFALGALEILGVVEALSTEWGAPPSPDGKTVGISRTLFDVDHKFLGLTDGTRVHYVDEGAGETLLFLHGNPSWSFQWRDLIQGLKGAHRCVALDYPGFGFSTAPAGFGYSPREQSRVVEEFVDGLGLRDVTLVLHDWGGPIGIGLAIRRPELVRRVVLGSTWAWPTSRTEPRGMFSLLGGGPIGEFAQMNFNGLAVVLQKNEVNRELQPDVREAYAYPFRPWDRRGIAAFYPGQITADAEYFAELESGLPGLSDKPALIFWGLNDPGFPAGDLIKWQATFPNSKTVKFSDAKHFFFEDTADKMIPEIRKFAGTVGREAR